MKPAYVSKLVVLMATSLAISACSKDSGSSNNNQTNPNNQYPYGQNPYGQNNYGRPYNPNSPFQQNGMNNMMGPQNQQANSQWQLAQAQADATRNAERARLAEARANRRRPVDTSDDSTSTRASSANVTTSEVTRVVYVTGSSGSTSNNAISGAPCPPSRPQQAPTYQAAPIYQQAPAYQPAIAQQPAAQQPAAQQQTYQAPLIARPGAVAAATDAAPTAIQNQIAPIAAAPAQAATIAPATSSLLSGASDILTVNYVSKSQLDAESFQIYTAVTQIKNLAKVSKADPLATPIQDLNYMTRLSTKTILQANKKGPSIRETFIPGTVAKALIDSRLCDLNTVGACLVLERDSRIKGNTENRAYLLGGYGASNGPDNGDYNIVRKEIPASKALQEKINLILANQKDGIWVFTNAELAQ